MGFIANSPSLYFTDAIPPRDGIRMKIFRNPNAESEFTSSLPSQPGDVESVLDSRDDPVPTLRTVL